MVSKCLSRLSWVSDCVYFPINIDAFKIPLSGVLNSWDTNDKNLVLAR